MAKSKTHWNNLLEEAWQEVNNHPFGFTEQVKLYYKQLSKNDTLNRNRLQVMELAVLNAKGQYQEVIDRAGQLKSYFNKEGDVFYAGVTQSSEARALSQMGLAAKALPLVMTAIENLTAHKSHACFLKAEHTLADVFISLGFYEQAHQILVHHQQIAGQQQSALGVFILTAQIAALYTERALFQQADTYLREAEDAIVSAGIQMPFTLVLYRQRLLWLVKQKKAREALKYYRATIALLHIDIPKIQCALLELKATAHKHLKQWNEAIAAINECIVLSQNNKLESQLMHARLELADIWLGQKNLKQAGDILQQLTGPVTIIGSLKFELRHKQLLATWHEQTNDAEGALLLLKRILEIEHELRRNADELQMTALRLLATKEFAEQEMNQIKKELAMKQDELQISAVYLQQHQNMLHELDKFMTELRQDNQRKGNLFKEVHHKVRALQLHDADKQVIEEKINREQQAYVLRLKKKFPALSATEARICTLLKSGMSSKEVSALLLIEVKTIEQHRYRIRKKLHMNKGDDWMMVLHQV